MSDVIVVGAKEFDDKIKGLMRAVEPTQRKRALMRGGLVIEGWIKRNVQEQGLIDTGNLRASVTAETEGDSAVSIGPRNVAYAAIHEFGGTIRPVNAQWLAIPVTKKARSAGSPRRFGGDLRFKLVAGGAALVDGNDDLQYVLRKSVNIPARPYVRPAMDEHVDEAMGAIERYLQDEFRKVVG